MNDLMTAPVVEQWEGITHLNGDLSANPYREAIQRAKSLWSPAAYRYDGMLQWERDNPVPEGTEERKQWVLLRDNHRTEQGSPAIGDPGQIEWDGYHHAMKLRAPIRNPETDAVVYGYISTCGHCKQLIASTKRERYCSNVCKHVAKAKLKEEDNAILAEIRAEVSAALASRKGTCLCCGETFNLKRTTAKVCSERCKKQLQRKPHLLADQLTNLLPELNDSFDYWKQQVSAASDIRIAALFGRPVEQSAVALAEKVAAEYPPLIAIERIKRCLHAAAKEAPALAAWLLKQPESVVEDAFGKESYYVLGSALVAKLRKQELVR